MKLENMNKKEEVIIIAQQEYKDNDVILHVLGKTIGKASFYARGIKKSKSKNASACRLFQKSNFIYTQTNRAMQSIKSAEKIQMYTHLYDDLLKQTIASIMCEILNKQEQVEENEAYILLSSSLEYLNETQQPFCVLALFLAQCSNMFGYSPQVDTCVRCHSVQQISSISIKDGGFVCVQCKQEERKQDLALLKVFRLFHKASITDFEVLEKYMTYDYTNIQKIVEYFVYHSGLQLKSFVFLEQVIAFE